jgi:penicillin-binding protein 1B
MKVFKYILISSTILLLLALGVTAWLWQEYRLISAKLSLMPQQASLSQLVKFEQQALVQTNEFGHFTRLFLDKSSPKPTLNNITPKLSEIGLAWELSLPLNNSCQDVYCLKFSSGFSNIPSSLWKGLIGVEDIRFLTHSGVDWYSILRAILIDLKQMRLAQGGSTITQQLVKNLFFTNQKSFQRKFKEIIFSYLLERQYTKDQIVSAYLNEVYWGVIGGIKLKGFFSASMAYFGKHPSFLNEFESVVLIALLKGPAYYHPIKNHDRLKARVDALFKKLLEKNIFTTRIQAWKNREWSDWITQLSLRVDEKIINSVWYLYQKPNQDISLYSQYLWILNSLKMKNELEQKFPEHDLNIKIWAKKIRCEECSEYFFYTKPERKAEQALKVDQHQLGSIIKPIVYEIFLENNIKWSDIVTTEPTELKLKSGTWTPSEASKQEIGEISLEQSLLKSRNIPTIKFAQALGFDLLEFSLKQKIPQLKLPLNEFPAQLLGAIELSMKQIGEMYHDFIVRQCILVKRGIEQFENTVLFRLADARVNTLSKRANQYIKNLHIFGKTGTTNNALDNWFIGYDGELLVLIWLGDEKRTSAQSLPLAGASTAFEIYQATKSFSGVLPSELTCY